MSYLCNRWRRLASLALAASVIAIGGDRPAAAQDTPGAGRVRPRFFNPFLPSFSSRLKLSPLGLPRFQASLTETSETATAPAAAVTTSDASTSNAVILQSVGRPPFRPPSRSPFRPPPRPPFF